jgi:hypothetical protein
MQSKTERIKTTLARGDWLSALRIASCFHDRSHDTLTFKRGFDAYQHPDFYRQWQGPGPDSRRSNKALACSLPPMNVTGTHRKQVKERL